MQKSRGKKVLIKSRNYGNVRGPDDSGRQQGPSGVLAKPSRGPLSKYKAGKPPSPPLPCLTSLPHNTLCLLNPLTFSGTATTVINAESWSEVLAYRYSLGGDC